MLPRLVSSVLYKSTGILMTSTAKLNPTTGILYRMASTSKTLDLKGIYPPIATPFNDDESIAYDKLKHNMDMWNKMPLRGYLVQGSNGEVAYLSSTERVEMISRARSLIPEDKLLLAGSGCESTQATIEMSNEMAKAGADAVLVVTPCYYKGRMTDSALTEHYKKVADNSSIPVVLYSVPANTGIDLSPSVIVELSNHPNIIGMKDSGGDITKISSVIQKTEGRDFQVLAGSASFLYTSLMMGAVGGVCGLANILGNECCQLQSYIDEGKHVEAKKLQQRLIAPNTGVTKSFGVSGLKAAMEWFEFYGGPVRSPLQPLTAEESSVLRKQFSDYGFI